MNEISTPSEAQSFFIPGKIFPGFNFRYQIINSKNSRKGIKKLVVINKRWSRYFWREETGY